jgi:hypothetical protein
VRKIFGSLIGSVLASAGVLVAIAPPAGAEPVTVTFEYTGAVQNWVVPAGVQDLAVELFGAQGGDSNYSFSVPGSGSGASGMPGGHGGRTASFLAVTSGETLRIVVGGRGADGDDGGAGGFNGGGNGLVTREEFTGGFRDGRSGGGGGGSDVRQGGIQLSHRVAVAGGGGGAPAEGEVGDIEGSGDGGGLSGDRGIGPVVSDTKFHGDGGSQTAGGAGGGACPGLGAGTAGVLGRGGDGGGGSASGAGGGGGGGLYGGGGGGAKNCSGGQIGAGGGGGGSGYESTGLGVTSFNDHLGDGQVTITYTPAPPGPPQNVSAVAGNGQATVSFSPPADSGTFPVTGYRAICGNPDSGPSNTGSSSPIVVSGLANGVTVTCLVQAISAAGDGFFSAPSNAVTPQAAPTLPGAPTGVSAARGNERATVTFSPPSSNGGSAILDYTATCGSSSKTGASSPLVVTGLTNGTTVGCTVKARNAVGSGPASSPAVPVKPATVPGKPVNVSATAGNAQATVKFAKPASNGGSGILDYTATCGSKTKTGAGSPLVVAGLSNGVTVNCTVTARNAIGTGPASSPPVAVRPRP